MKRLIFSVIACVIGLAFHADENENPFNPLGLTDCIGAFIADKTDTNLRATPGGKIVETIPHSDNYVVTVCKPTNGWWQIVYISNIEGKEIEVPEAEGKRWWIHSSVLALGTRNYGRQWVHLYSSPSDKAKVVFKSRDELTVTPLDLKDNGDWVKVSVIIKGKKYVGWIEAENLCDNPVTNCC